MHKINKKVSSNKDSLKTEPEKIDFAVAGIGASAGGLETLEVFFRNMPRDSGISFVIVQHLSPKHKSIMASLLAKHTSMTVREIEDKIPLEPDCVYVNPPDRNIAVFNRVLHLMDIVKTGAINMPVDYFFRSLSEDLKEKAIAVILSGTASDGTLGIKCIKDRGGMVMVEDPDTAKYGGMPESAVKTGLVDFILPVEKMPEQLISYLKHPVLKKADKKIFTETGSQAQFQKIFTLIRNATGHDFSHYKRSTIERRVERRLAIHQIDSLSDYILFLKKYPSEIEKLFKNLVVGVTSFFRDPEAYAVIEKQVIEKLVDLKHPERVLRCWVVGCSTGEEAYSLAILISEAMKRLQKHINVQIFATDIDPAAIDTARKGIYPASIAGDISTERLKKFFIREETFLKVNKQIRDMVVFSIQSVIKDPPFSRLDIVSCRNLMIYLDPVLQKKMIRIFHYTLNPGGIMQLGTSETIGEFTDLFMPIDSKWKIFRKKEGISSETVDYSKGVAYERHRDPGKAEGQPPAAPTDVEALAEKAIMEDFAPSGVLVNDKFEILHFIGGTEKYLIPPTGRPSFNILSMARQDLKYKLTTSLNKAFREKKRVSHKGIKLDNSPEVVDLSVAPLSGKDTPPGLMLVVFEERKPDPAQQDEEDQKTEEDQKPSEVKELEQELQSAREYLQSTIEELETSNEELKSSNEELQSVNEELQSSNEELETSKEELQSTNEELSTVNSELQSKVDDLSKSSNDMNNLLAATEIASIFLDTNLCIKRYTPAAAGVIKLIPTDIGRPIGDLKTIFPKVDLADLAEKVLMDLNTVKREILSEGNVWYALKMLPYRTIDNVIEGVVIVFININEIKKADMSRRLAVVLEDSNDAITLLNFDGGITAWNKGAESMYGYSESEALQMNFSALIPKDRQGEIKDIASRLKDGETIKSYETQRLTKDRNFLDVWLTATVLKNESGQQIGMAVTERDLAWLSKGQWKNDKRK